MPLKTDSWKLKNAASAAKRRLLDLRPKALKTAEELFQKSSLNKLNSQVEKKKSVKCY